ncbi:MAG TPA: hypothetical protein VKU42_11475 [Candidatus Angelobacter sp.]|nr:hypothetical protein [Candidatus Angelobacter sp.]
MNKVRIDSEETFAHFLDAVDSFHDALLHEAVLLHPGFIMTDGATIGDLELPNARLIFQSPFENIAAIQLDLKRVSSFCIDFRRDFKWRAEFRPGQIRLCLAGSQDFEICAAEMEYTLLRNDARGPKYQMVRDDLLVDDLFFNEL